MFKRTLYFVSLSVLLQYGCLLGAKITSDTAESWEEEFDGSDNDGDGLVDEVEDLQCMSDSQIDINWCSAPEWCPNPHDRVDFGAYTEFVWRGEEKETELGVLVHADEYSDALESEVLDGVYDYLDVVEASPSEVELLYWRIVEDAEPPIESSGLLSLVLCER